jgi:hypothetical protein
LARSVEITIEYDTPNEKGTTKRRLLAQVGDKAPSAAVSPLLQYLLDTFWRISASERASNGFGHSRLSSANIVAWLAARGVKFDEWELDIIQAMDASFIRAVQRRVVKNG